jgi:hypothetical protein
MRLGFWKLVVIGVLLWFAYRFIGDLTNQLAVVFWWMVP